jgi:hypothetical protein
VRLVRDSEVADDIEVEVLHALGGSRLERTRLGEFVGRFAGEFGGGGCVVDQPYQDRLGEGMIRCYMTHDRVVGFGHQFVTALIDPPEGSVEVPPPPPRLYYGPDKAEFQVVKGKLESGWIADLQERVGIETHSLPVIWDADFLLGPPSATGEDTYVLCEINVSSVFPMPDEAFAPLAAAAVEAVARSQ